MNPQAYIWLGLMVLFLVAEAATAGMVSLWFAGGALAALAVTLLGGRLWLQLTAFLAISAVLLLLLRPVVRRFVNPRIIPTNADSVIGTVGIVTEDIDNVEACGRVKVGTMSWSARSTSGSPLTQGLRVRVDRIEGVKVFVSEVKEEVRV